MWGHWLRKCGQWGELAAGLLPRSRLLVLRKRRAQRQHRKKIDCHSAAAFCAPSQRRLRPWRALQPLPPRALRPCLAAAPRLALPQKPPVVGSLTFRYLQQHSLVSQLGVPEKHSVPKQPLLTLGLGFWRTRFGHVPADLLWKLLLQCQAPRGACNAPQALA